jgi:hypothetical protein
MSIVVSSQFRVTLFLDSLYVSTAAAHCMKSCPGVSLRPCLATYAANHQPTLEPENPEQATTEHAKPFRYSLSGLDRLPYVPGSQSARAPAVGEGDAKLKPGLPRQHQRPAQGDNETRTRRYSENGPAAVKSRQRPRRVPGKARVPCLT